MRKFFALASMIFLVITIWTFLSTFGLLETDGFADTEYEFGKWYITLNGVDITVDNSITADDLIYLGNQNVEDGYFAPGVSAGYEIIIDPNDTDVSVRFDITIDMTEIDDHENIEFTVTGDNIVRRETNEGVVYTGIIPLSSIKQGETTEIQTGLIWTNDEDYDDIDNRLSEFDSTLKIKISINFSQYLGEAF